MRPSVLMMLVACNNAPAEWWDLGVAPGGLHEWGTPSEGCDPTRIAPGDPYIDGFYLCMRENDIVPVDDPVFVACDRTALGPDGAAVLPHDDVFAVFDGIHARGYPMSWLATPREAIHDWMGGTPILVDW